MTLDDEGKLRLSYMGTDPSMDAVDIKHSAEVDYAALDSEYRELAGQIKAVGVTPVALAAEDQLIITAQVHCPLSLCTVVAGVLRFMAPSAVTHTSHKRKAQLYH